MLRTGVGSCATRSALRVCGGIASVCVLVLSSLIWSAPAAVGQPLPDGFPLNLESLERLVYRRTKSSHYAKIYNTRFCGNYDYDAAWLGYTWYGTICLIYRAADGEFWLMNGDRLAPLTGDIEMLMISVGDISLLFVDCEEKVLRCSRPMVMPPGAVLDLNDRSNLVIEVVGSDVEIEGIEQLRERVPRFSSLPWFAKLCYVTDTLRYSDNCEDEFASPMNFDISIADLDARNSFTLTWHGNTTKRDNLTTLPSTMYIRDISTSTPEKIECALDDTRRKTAVEGYQSYTCTGHTLEFEGGFIVLGSRSMAATAGGIIIELPLPEVRVVAMEVTQGVQNWENDLTLVKNRRTAVRVFMETDVRKRKVTANLRGTVLPSQGGRTIGEMPPVNHNLSVEVAPVVAERRDKIEASLNFVLPMSWSSIDENAQLQLEVVFDEKNIRCSNKCSEIVSFAEITNAPNIVMIPLSIKNGSKSDTSIEILNEQYNRIMSIMPLPYSKYLTLEEAPRIYRGPYFELLPVISRKSNIKYYTDLLETLQMDGQKNYVYLGVLPGEAVCTDQQDNSNTQEDEEDCPPSGIASDIPDIDEWPGSAASWYTGGNDDGSGLLSMSGKHRNNGGHELGHLFGQHHPIRIRSEENRIKPGFYRGECKEISEAEDVYPHFELIDDPEVPKLNWRPALGPLGNPKTEVWGLDIRYISLSNSSDYRDLAVINPYKIFSFMSYCRNYPTTVYNQGSWIDSHHHEEIIDFLLAPKKNNLNTSSNILVRSDLISGSLISSESSELVVDFDPIFSRPRLIESIKSGEFSLNLLDGENSVIRSIPFDFTGNREEFADDALNISRFSIIIPDPPEYSSFSVTQNSHRIFSMDRSSNTPVLSIYGPSEGEYFDIDDSINVRWRGEDLDGDDLIYRIYFSKDAGRNYQIISMDTEEQSLSVSAGLLGGSNQARIGVSVSDGTRSTFAETQVFTIANNKPNAWIESPSTNSIFTTEQPISFEAYGYDIEDGYLDASSFVWHSSVDGYVGSGDFLVIPASDMTAGEHQITLTARDSEHIISTASAIIVINDRNMPPSSADDTISVNINEVSYIDALANDIDPENDINPSTFSLKSLPKLGSAKIYVSLGGVPVIEYISDIDGIDTFIYEICDYGDVCDTALVKIDIVIPNCTIVGTSADDNLVGTSEDDIICGLGGNDIIDGRSGNDKIYGGEGEDTIYGRSGNDMIYGGSGDDFILGHSGNDIIYGNSGNDKIYAGGGDDIVKANEGDDELYGESENDNLEGGRGHDRIHGGRGNDIIRGDEGDDIIRGNAGEDIIYPGLGDDTILGISPEDSIL